MRTPCVVSLACLLIIISPTLLPATIIKLRPSADTTLIETSPNNNMGAQPFFNSGTTGINTRNRGLLMFDLTGLIPPNAMIESVDLSIEVVGSPTAGQGEFSLFGLHQVLVPWGEGDKTQSFSPGLGEPATENEATWNDRFFGTGQPWSEPGGASGTDYVAAPSALTFIGFEDLYEFESSIQLVNDVQQWVNDPTSNFGWMLITDAEDTEYTARRFGSREDSLFAPVLTVQFQPVPEPASVALWSLGLMALGGFLHRNRRKR